VLFTKTAALGSSVVCDSLRRRAQSAQSSQVVLETSFCPLSLSHLGRNPNKARRDHQKDAVICAFSGLASALLDAQGMRVA
jgi:hypothetical protein